MFRLKVPLLSAGEMQALVEGLNRDETAPEREAEKPRDDWGAGVRGQRRDSPPEIVHFQFR